MCRYGEIALKGRNRSLFEKQLVRNIRACLERNSILADVKPVRGRIFLFTQDTDALKHLRHVFGLVSISPAVVCDSTPKDIERAVLDYTADIIRSSAPKTFRISAKRIDKRFSKSSGDMDILLGTAVGEKFGLKAMMKGADLDIGVEIHSSTYIFHDILPCHGGLPLGISGNVACLIEKDQDLAAAWLVMRRGCNVFPVLKADVDLSQLVRYAYGEDLISSEVRDIFNINEVMKKRRCRALVVADTFEEFDPEKYLGSDAAVLTPLIGYDKTQIKELLERIRG
jgi:thiamine biosynthesis protein ThiI